MTHARTHAHNGTSTSLQLHLLLLGAVRMLLGELSAEGGDLGLKRRHLVLVVLLHACHALLDLADVLPHVRASLAAHDFAHAAGAAAAVTRHASGLRRGPRTGYLLMLEHAWAICLSTLRAWFGNHGWKAREHREVRSIRQRGRHGHWRRSTADAAGEVCMHVG